MLAAYKRQLPSVSKKIQELQQHFTFEQSSYHVPQPPGLYEGKVSISFKNIA
jgi:hypothetical protein